MIPTIHILLLALDDDQDMLDLVEPVLHSVGIDDYKLFLEEEEFEKHLTSGIHICLIDHYLSKGKTGLPLCKEIKKKSPHSFIVVISGQGSMQVVIDYLNSCADRYVDKNKQDHPKQLVKFLEEGLKEAKDRKEEIEMLTKKIEERRKI